jgi:hypothetical protein
MPVGASSDGKTKAGESVSAPKCRAALIGQMMLVFGNELQLKMTVKPAQVRFQMELREQVHSHLAGAAGKRENNTR